jgi:hypothetical protein
VVAQVKLESLVNKGLQVQLAIKEIEGQLGQLEQQEALVQLGALVQRVLLVNKVSKAVKDLKALQELQVLLVQADLWVNEVKVALLAPQGQLVLLDH